MAHENLTILCPNHHREIDYLRPQDFSAEGLMEMKVNHESACANKNWAGDALLDFAAASVLASSGSSIGVQAEVALETHLIIQEGRGDTFEVANVGEQDAFNVTVEAIGGQNSVLRLEEDAARRLSPGASWRAGLYAQTMGESGNPSILVRWENNLGQGRDAEFPLI